MREQPHAAHVQADVAAHDVPGDVPRPRSGEVHEVWRAVLDPQVAPDAPACEREYPQTVPGHLKKGADVCAPARVPKACVDAFSLCDCARACRAKRIPRIASFASRWELNSIMFM